MLEREDQRDRGPEPEAIEEQPSNPDQVSEPRLPDIAWWFARDGMHGLSKETPGRRDPAPGR
jgi:hypothetical protein